MPKTNSAAFYSSISSPQVERYSQEETQPHANGAPGAHKRRSNGKAGHFVAKPAPVQRYPLSSLQSEVWLNQALHPGAPLFNIGGHLRIGGSIDCKRFAAALHWVIEQHDALRIRLHRDPLGDSMTPSQSFREPIDFTLEEGAFEGDEAAARQWMADEFTKPLPLDQGSLFQFALCKVTDECCYWFIKLHYLIADGPTLALLVNQVVAVYAALNNGSPLPIANPFSYQDFVEVDAAYLNSTALTTDLAYWQTTYQGLPEPLLPHRHSAYFAGQATLPSKRTTLVINGSHWEQLTILAATAGVSPAQALLGLTYSYFARYSGQEDCVIGLVNWQRRTSDFIQTFGFFTNVTPTRCTFGLEDNFVTLLRRLKQQMQQDARHANAPLGYLNRQANLTRQGRQQLFELEVAYADLTFVESLAGAPVQFTLLSHGHEQYPLTLYVEKFCYHQPASAAHRDASRNARLDTKAPVRIHFDYNLAAFTPAEMELLKARFAFWLSEIVRQPDAPLHSLSILPPAERLKLLVEFNATAAPLPATSIHTWFETQAARAPDAIAIISTPQPPTSGLQSPISGLQSLVSGLQSLVCGLQSLVSDPQSPISGLQSPISDLQSPISGLQSPVSNPPSLTYRELNARANQLAHYLRTLGVGPEVLVGIAVERSCEMIIAVLGVLKAGGAYIPLDPHYPPERLAWMLADANPPVLLTQRHLLEKYSMLTPPQPSPDWGGSNDLVGESRIPPSDWRKLGGGGNSDPVVVESKALGAPRAILCLDHDWTTIAQFPEQNLALPSASDQLAYIIYTSGSTGKPKGALLTHRGLCNAIQAQIERYGVTPASRLFQFVSFSFDVATADIFIALCAGASLYLPPSGQEWDLTQQLRASASTHFHCPPAVLATLTPDAAPALQTVMTGGESASVQLVQTWARNHRYFNAYGPTETTILATIAQCSAETPVAPSIGRPIANTQIYLLDANQQPVPIGAIGEIYIGGLGVARGYLNQPALTQERFLLNPFINNSDPSAFATRHPQLATPPIYKTGDLARYRPNGDLEFIGRVDNQVKIRGFRIELGEIEATLGQHPAVQAGVVTVHRVGEHDKQLVAYLVLHPGQSVDAAQVQHFLSTRLPHYMLPAQIVTMTTLPRTPNGKIDRSALPLPPVLADQSLLVAPQTKTEQLIATTWGAVLGTPALGVTDNFFALGGDSIKVMVAVNQLQTQLQTVLHPTAIFHAPTVRQLAAYLEEQYPEAVARWSGAPSPVAPALRGKITATDVTNLRARLPALAPLPVTSAPKNRRAIFILCSPRSGSTLLRVMLGGHSQLFAPPELLLLPYTTLTERALALTGENHFWRDGVLQTLMQLKGFDLAQAEEFMRECALQGMTIQQFYGLLQAELGPQRFLVDKSPFYMMDLNILRRAEVYFEDAIYIHLTRHPYAVARSIEEMRLDQILYAYLPMLRELDGAQALSPRAVGELVWLVNQQNILKFLEKVPVQRQQRVAFEELVKAPQQVMERLCQTLGIPFERGMVQPYQDKSQRMTAGLHQGSRLLGDIKFHQHQGIEASMAERWQSERDPTALSDMSWEVAAALGYTRPNPPASRVEQPSQVALAEAWIRRPKPNPAAHLRLFCFPYAGGGASLFRRWPEQLPAEVELCAIQLPGRENRLGEATYTDLPTLTAALVEVLRPALDRPYAFFGHSMGALLAFEVARQLRRQGLPMPLHLFVAARRAVQLPNRGRSLAGLNDAEFVTALRASGAAVSSELADDQGMLQLMLPTLRADVGLVETYTYQAEAPLSCPITALGGDQDQRANRDDLAAWALHTQSEFRLRLFAGNHFFLRSAEVELLRVLTEEMGRYL